jgi:sulfonate transport system permease protein
MNRLNDATFSPSSAPLRVNAKSAGAEAFFQPKHAPVQTTPTQRKETSGGKFWLSWIFPLALLGIAEIAARTGWIEARLLPPPSEILHTLLALFDQGLLGHLQASVARVATGYVIGAGFAIVIGIAVALNRNLEALLDPTFQALRAIPSLAWVPLLLLWFGIDETPKIVLITIGAFFPIYVCLVSGIQNVDRKLIELGEMYGLSKFALAYRIVLPASLPSLFTGLRNGLSLAWMFLVAAELIAATKGVGYLLTDGRETSRADVVLAAIVLLALLGKFTDGLLKRLEKRKLYWCDSLAGRSA